MIIKTIDSINNYIVEIKNIVKEKNEKQIIVYRGESQDYKETSFVPNIFRDENYRENKNYETNLYTELYSSGIVGKQSLLETAIDAQHGGFPSRLLDVTYNSLVALYFATEKASTDNSNPRVAIFFIDEIYTPGSYKSEALFENVIDYNSFYRKIKICSKNHKLIDHMNKNDRIKAQQGAFILFQGNDSERIPKYMYKIIEIEKSKVKSITKDLKDLFGLTVGKIYPEPSNQIDVIKEKMKFVNSEDHSIENEFKLSIDNFFKKMDFEIRDFEKKIISKSIVDIWDFEKEFINELDKIESKFLTFRQDIKESIDQVENLEIDNFKALEEYVSKYFNKQIISLCEKVEFCIIKVNKKVITFEKHYELSYINEFLI